MKQITKSSDVLSKKVIVNRISDIPGGVSLAMATLVAGSVVAEGTPLSAPATGVRSICKQAIISATSTNIALKVPTVTNQFKVGDIIGSNVGGKAVTITGITTASGVDTIAVDSAVETFAVGTVLYEMAAATLGTDTTLNIAVSPGTSTGITEDLTSTAGPASPGQSTVATVVGTTTEPGNATVVVSTDLHADVTLSVAIADNDTPEVAAYKIRNAIRANAVLAPLFDVVGDGALVQIVHKAVPAVPSTLKRQADAILKEAFTVPSDTQVIFIADALVRADVHSGNIGAEYLATLDVNEIKY